MWGLACHKISAGAPAATNSVKHLAAVKLGVLDLAVELAIGKGAGAALAELHVRFRREYPAPPQRPGILGALAHACAALDDNRPQTGLGENERSEQAAWAGADHDRPQLFVATGAGDRLVGHVRRRHHIVVVGEAGKDRSFVLNLGVEGVDELDRRALAGVGAAPEHA